MKRVRTFTLDQPLLLPLSLHDWLAEKHLARFLAEIGGELDLKPVLETY